LSGEVIRSVTEGPDGAIWTAHQAGFESFLPGARPAIRWAGEFPWCVYGDSRGRVWMGTYGGGLSVWEGNRQIPLEPIPKGDRGTITLVFEGPGKEIWIGRENGLWRFVGSRLERETLPDAVSGMAVRSMAADSNARLWLGLDGGGLLRREAGGWVPVSIPGVEGAVTVSALLADSKGSVWAATSGRGLCRFREGSAAIRLETGVESLPRRPSSLLEDGLGYLWIGSSDGIFRVRADDLDARADGLRRDVVARRFGREDGLESSECAASVQPSALRSRDNRLWFATFRGVSVVDPRRLDPEPPPPPIWVEEAILWGRKKSRIPFLGQGIAGDDIGSGGRVFDIPAETHLLEVHYTAPRFNAGERVRFRYRLVGLDSDWVEAGSRRVAYYQALGVGTYHFEVSACNQDGDWNPNPARVTLRKRPHFWETWPFRGTIAAGLFLLAFAAYRFRVRAFTRIRRAREEYSRRLIASQESERQRIARELHDSLGQNLLVIKSRVALAQQQAAHPEKVADQLREAAEMTLTAIREVREISQNLRPFQLDELGLAKAVIAALRKVAAISPIQFSVDVGELQGVFPLESEIHVFRILQECLNNVVKHSGAARCRLTVAVQTAQVRIEVEDDGHGFGEGVQPLGSVSREGNGLSNIEERARILGGSVEFGAGSAGGARVTVTLPRGA
jgi:signal transduction histidine kinase